MGRILDYLESSSDGKYHCFKTKKFSLDTSISEVLNYDDKPASATQKSTFAESDKLLVPTVKIQNNLIEKSRPIFSCFLDGSRHIYKVDDIAIGKKIFPFMAGQIIVGCCERQDRDTFKPFQNIVHKVVLSLPDEFDYDDKGENFCRLYCEKINEKIKGLPFVAENGIMIDKILLYKTDQKDPLNPDKDTYKNRGTAIIQSEMTDEEQRVVAKLCENNKLDDEHYLIKDGSLEYNPCFSNKKGEDKLMQRENYRYVVGVSKSFDPELIPDYQGHKLSNTIANLKPFERTKAYRYYSDSNNVEYAVWYLRLRKNDFRETSFSDVIKCEMVILEDGGTIQTDLIDLISANLIKEAYPVCNGNDTRWANHLYPVYSTESYCKSKYYNSDIILNLF
ncbi:MAG: hypothetical protein E7070_06680 [Bacteroidales bacterium]|jgi:hypothetical protein|nr:hypothetical protein [Bacteroidales bacterium]